MLKGDSWDCSQVCWFFCGGVQFWGLGFRVSVLGFRACIMSFLSSTRTQMEDRILLYAGAGGYGIPLRHSNYSSEKVWSIRAFQKMTEQTPVTSTCFHKTMRISFRDPPYTNDSNGSNTSKPPRRAHGFATCRAWWRPRSQPEKLHHKPLNKREVSICLASRLGGVRCCCDPLLQGRQDKLTSWTRAYVAGISVPKPS